MARYDVYADPGGKGYLLEIQSDLAQGLNTRIVVPLLPPRAAPKPARHLNPTVAIAGKPFVMVTQFMAVVPLADLRKRVQSLAHEHHAIAEALDMIFFGF
jgi:toxin CcdB